MILDNHGQDTTDNLPDTILAIIVITDTTIDLPFSGVHLYPISFVTHIVHPNNYFFGKITEGFLHY